MGEEISVTFETLYDFLMKEKKNDDLLELDESFFEDVINYMDEKEEVLDKVSDDDDLFTKGEKDKVESEIENIKKVLKDLYNRREKKIINLAINESRTGAKADKSHLLDEEKKLLEGLTQTLSTYREGILRNLINSELPSVEEKKMVSESNESVSENEREESGKEEVEEQQKETKTVKFKAAVPKFIGSDMSVYGPFDEKDVANLPEDVAEVIIDKGRGEEIE